MCHIVSLRRTSLVDHRGFAAMPKTMKQMKAIFKKYLQERVRVQRAASAIVAAHQAVLLAQHDLVLMQAMEARENGDTDDEWLIAHEYENEEWEDGV